MSVVKTELLIPKERREIIAAIVLSLLIAGFMAATVYLAFHNLINFQGIVPSFLWLLLVGVFFFALFTEYPLRRLGLNILGLFALKHFLEADSTAAESKTIALGFRFWGRKFYYFKVSPRQIDEVHWSSGQLSSKCGKDMNDWQVALWLAPNSSGSENALDCIYLLGQAGAKKEVEAFGLSVVKFLRDAGAKVTAQTVKNNKDD